MTRADDEAHADAQAHDQAPRVRGLSPADAIAVVLIATMVGVFLNARSLVAVVLVAGIACMYAIFRTTRGQPLPRRALLMIAILVVAMLLAMALVRLGY